MKKITLIAVFLFSLSMSAQEKVGENRNGTYVITASLNLLKPAWDKLAEEPVTNYSIVGSVSDNVQQYYLLGKTASGEIKIATGLDLKDNTFLKAVTVSNTAICYGSTNCTPKKSGNGWICDDGTKTASCSKDCQKMVVSAVKN